MDNSDDILIECSEHGERRSAIVCRHLLQENSNPIGFIENSSDPGDYQAWCCACEELFLKENEMTEAFRRFNDFAVVCEVCYEQIKARHLKGNEG
jgi:hypothetical protein